RRRSRGRWRYSGKPRSRTPAATAPRPSCGPRRRCARTRRSPTPSSSSTSSADSRDRAKPGSSVLPARKAEVPDQRSEGSAGYDDRAETTTARRRSISPYGPGLDRGQLERARRAAPAGLAEGAVHDHAVDLSAATVEVDGEAVIAGERAV